VTNHTAPLDGPADTQTMGIVHSALRRDVVRVKMVLGTPAAREPRRRTAIAEHLIWMMDFLHHHHQGEDDGLYPLVVGRNPSSAGLVERMDADHESITPAMAGLEQAARRHLADRESPDDRLVEAIGSLCDVLLPHLAREEQDMMPVVSETITEREWRDWDEEFNIKPKGMRELADEGHWIIDGLTGPAREHIEHLVPPVPRFILIRLMGGRYARKRSLLWDGTPAADVPSIPVDAMEAWVR
jgi:hemerythrin-like domain-containing protein